MKQYKYLSNREKKQIIKKHFEKGISQTQLTKEYDANRTTVSIICRNHGVSPLLKDYKLNDREIIRLYTEDKKSVFQIAEIMNMTPRPITRRLRMAGVIKKVSKRNHWEKIIPHYFLKMKIWVAKVIEADGMKCRMCKCENTFKNRLEANHIVPVRDMETPNLLFDISNGICLCRKCHMKIHYHEKEYEIQFRNLIQTRSSG